MQKDNLFRALTPAGEVREKDDGKLVLTGHFARFGEWTEISGSPRARSTRRFRSGPRRCC
jgi:hypothetical protein